jgi:N-acetylglucosamine-6-sulfatase
MELRAALSLLLVTAASGAARKGAPNIVLILTDDQDHFHANDTSLNAMPRAHELLAKRGATFGNFYVNTPVCCASRSELLSGRLNHNIRMPTPVGGCMHMWVVGLGRERAKRSTI